MEKHWDNLFECNFADLGHVFALLNLIWTIACVPASMHATNLMHVKNSMRHSCLWHLLSGTLEQRKWKKEQKHQI